MKRSIIVSFMCVALIGAFVLPSLFAADAPKGAVEMKAFPTKTKASPKFDHATHKLDCKACHHKWDGKAPVKKCATAGCHDDFKEKKGEKSAYASMHDPKSKLSCVGCHKAGGKGPLKCDECHPKK